eukprot:TRINITY_DN34281_c0_g1_i1.p2 TRINITY_DN34281_c0_g1~~TRINITY_DN34281_c0_g1_i1.p2  ORF type:complete len:328 (+),score=109.46 TRINITY_DN34281_c0_g1_i1:51-1034(+)
MAAPVLWADVASQLRALDKSPSAAALLHTFIRVNLDAESSRNLASPASDDLTSLFAVLSRPQQDAHTLPALRALRLLARKHVNREALLPGQADTLVEVLASCADGSSQSCVEACLCVRNLCVGRSGRCSDAAPLLTAAAVPLARLLRAAPGAAAAAASAVQSLCLASSGQRACAEAGCVGGLLLLLEETDADVLVPAAGALHNATAHPAACLALHTHSGVGAVVALLCSPIPEVRRCAAGAVQNLTRDPACLETLRDLRAAEALSSLLAQAHDPAAQVAAMGALLNLSGPARADPARRAALKAAMADAIAAAALREVVAESGMPSEP